MHADDEHDRHGTTNHRLGNGLPRLSGLNSASNNFQGSLFIMYIYSKLMQVHRQCRGAITSAMMLELW